jgi:hypothetical protein
MRAGVKRAGRFFGQLQIGQIKDFRFFTAGEAPIVIACEVAAPYIWQSWYFGSALFNALKAASMIPDKCRPGPVLAG